jgi:hypothetical protein
MLPWQKERRIIVKQGNADNPKFFRKNGEQVA